MCKVTKLKCTLFQNTSFPQLKRKPKLNRRLCQSDVSLMSDVSTQPSVRQNVSSKFMGKTFQAAQVTHEIFLTIDLPNLTYSTQGR